MDLKTPKSFVKIGSDSDLLFTATQRERIRREQRASVIPANLVKDFTERDFDEVVAKIEANDKTELCKTLEANHCNKSIAHNYTYLYDRLLSHSRKTDMTFIEVGLGTNNQDVPSMMGVNYIPGSSLRGWRDYFDMPTRNVIGLDVDERVFFDEPKLTTFYIDQTDPASIFNCYKNLGVLETGIDVILDDGLHTYLSNYTLLAATWGHLNRGGLYLIEDMAKGFYDSLMSSFHKLSFDADIIGFELPSTLKTDNRVIALQKR